MSFNKRLKKLRLERGLTQEQLANELDIPPSSIRRLETVNSLPRKERLEKIAVFFNVSVDFLLGRSDSKEIEQTIDDEILKELYQLSTENKKFVLDMIKKIQN